MVMNQNTLHTNMLCRLMRLICEHVAEQLQSASRVRPVALDVRLPDIYTIESTHRNIDFCSASPSPTHPAFQRAAMLVVKDHHETD